MRRPFVAIAALLGLLCAAVFGLSPTTRTGVQCPTASVQTLAVRDCCDRVVFRAPRPGDKAFVQCRCAERKAATIKVASATKLHLFVAASAPSVEVRSLLDGSVPEGFEAAFASRSVPPPTLPPAA